MTTIRMRRDEDHEQRPRHIRRKTASRIDEAEDAILARWEDPQDEASENETEAALEIEEETTDQTEFDEEDYEEVDSEEETDPEETMTIKRRMKMKLLKLKYWLTTLKSKSWSTVKLIGHQLRTKRLTVKRLLSPVSLKPYLSSANRLKMRCSAAMRATQAMRSRAEERLEPYSEVTCYWRPRQWTRRILLLWRKEAPAASEDVRFSVRKPTATTGNSRKQHQAAQKQAATEAVKVLQDAIRSTGRMKPTPTSAPMRWRRGYQKSR